MLLLLSFNTNAQTIEDVKKVLATKNPKYLENFVENKNSENFRMRWYNLREIISGYEEGILIIEEHIPREVPNTWRIITHRVNLLTTSNEIFYCEIGKALYGEGKIIETSEKYKNDSLNTIFENTYKQAYHDTLNHNDLFITNIIYGDRCSRVGIKPLYRQKLDSLILQKNASELHQWLISPNAEKQMYAIKGYKALTYMGYVLTNEDKRLLKLVRQKQTSIYTCDLCMYSDQSFQEAVAEIDKLSKADLLPHNSK
jgi:hypothetical protein